MEMSSTNLIPLNNVRISLPGLSIPVPDLGIISNITLNVASGSFNPQTNTLFVSSGVLYYTGGRVSGPANVTNLILTAGPNGFNIQGTACVKVFILGNQCQMLNTTLNYTSQLSTQTFLSAINTALGRVGGYRRHRHRTYHHDFAMKCLHQWY